MLVNLCFGFWVKSGGLLRGGDKANRLGLPMPSAKRRHIDGYLEQTLSFLVQNSTRRRM